MKLSISISSEAGMLVEAIAAAEGRKVSQVMNDAALHYAKSHGYVLIPPSVTKVTNESTTD
jgi:hypothetical protein